VAAAVDRALPQTVPPQAAAAPRAPTVGALGACLLQLTIQMLLLQPAQFLLQPQGSPDVPGEVAAAGQSVSAAVPVVDLPTLGPAAAAAAVGAAAVAVAL
jgi:hypothetical protein